MLEHVVSVQQFLDTKILESIFKTAEELQDCDPNSYPKTLENKIVATLFYEPSTRTRLSFETAVQRLGGNVITTENAGEFSSAIKGESLEDTIRTVNAYVDCIVIRHPEKGSAELAARYSDVPVINAGDGTGEHPTQALLDLYTIKRHIGFLKPLKVAMVGDLLNGRTVHSLVYLLGLYNVELYFIAPPDLQIPNKHTKYLEEKGLGFKLLSDWEGVTNNVDVIYMTRIQKERFSSTTEFEKYKHSFLLNKTVLVNTKNSTIVMHPLPRNSEISPDIDEDPRSIYFQQAKNGLYVRMALLSHLLPPGKVK